MVNIYTSYHYAILCYSLQGEVYEFIFLAMHHQTNGHNDQITLVDPLRGYESDTPTTQGIYGMGLTIGLPITITKTMSMALRVMELVAMALTLGPSILCIWFTLALLRKMARFAIVVASCS